MEESPQLEPLTQPQIEVQSGALTLECGKCTRVEAFVGRDRKDCDLQALRNGWVRDGKKMVCIKCPAVRLRRFR